MMLNCHRFETGVIDVAGMTICTGHVATGVSNAGDCTSTKDMFVEASRIDMPPRLFVPSIGHLQLSFNSSGVPALAASVSMASMKHIAASINHRFDFISVDFLHCYMVSFQSQFASLRRASPASNQARVHHRSALAHKPVST